MFTRLRNEEDGIAMVVSIMVAFVVLLLSTVIFSQSIHTSGRSAYGRNRLTAVDTAEAGLNYWYNYFQKTVPSNITTAAATGTVGSLPATGTYTATPTFYRDSVGTIAFSGSISSSNFPLSAKIKSTGTANGVTRTMESFITLRPIYGGIQGALISNDSSTTFTNSFTVNGNAGNDADIYILGSGAVFNVPSGLESIHGNVYVPAGTVNSIGTGVHIYGQVWANGSVLVNHPQALIDGNVNSTTGSVTVSTGTVSGSANYCTGSAPSNVARTTQTCALGAPPSQSFPQIGYVQSAWSSAGYTNFQTFTGASACSDARDYVESTGAYAATGFSGHSVGNTVVRITQACAYSNSNNGMITMNNNLAIITDGEISLAQQSNWNGVSSTRGLFFLSTWPASTCPASGSAGSHNVTLGNLTKFNTLVETFVYTPCTASMQNNNSAFTGQVIGTTLNIGNNFQENYRPIVVPGANLTGYNQDIAYIREVV